MALTIGIVDGIEKGFTKEELQVTNGFEFGLVCMHSGVGRLGDGGWRSTVITCEEAVERFTFVMDIMPIWDKDSFPYKWLTNLDNIKRLQVNDWYCNTGNESTDHFMHKMKQILFDITMRNRDEKFTHLHDRHSPSWSDINRQKDAVRGVVGNIVMGEKDGTMWSVEGLVDAFELWDMEYDGKYLHYDDDTCEYTLSNEKPQQEEWV